MSAFPGRTPHRKCYPGAIAFEISDIQEDETDGVLTSRSECNNVASG
jgi:hypothetical protein